MSLSNIVAAKLVSRSARRLGLLIPHQCAQIGLPYFLTTECHDPHGDVHRLCPDLLVQSGILLKPQQKALKHQPRYDTHDARAQEPTPIKHELLSHKPITPERNVHCAFPWPIPLQDNLPRNTSVIVAQQVKKAIWILWLSRSRKRLCIGCDSVCIMARALRSYEGSSWWTPTCAWPGSARTPRPGTM